MEQSLRQLREAKGLSQEKLAGLAGVTMGTVRNLEGGSTPRLDTARRIAEALGVTVDDCFPVAA